MFQSSSPGSLAERVRGKIGPKAIGMILALAAEAVLLWLLLSLGVVGTSGRDEAVTVVNLEAQPPSREAPEPEPSPEPQAAEPDPAPSPEAREVAAPQALPAPVARPQPAPPALPTIPVPRELTIPAPAAPPPARAPSPPADAPAFGPPAPRSGGAGADTARVGTAPNGEPLYAAAWYRRPTDAELRGYLSTASGPGWGLIACRTVPDYRVEDCVGLEEYPQGSQILRAVLAAAWQFRVRPPRLGGRPQVGEWVRIRIEYELRRE